ncbi:NAD-dependent epimerase/dehydratase family protein [Paucibacter sp. PLA-PC-4]|uniref:NAD-dependent epimerase/dehydratase family protein n=1 Tax=Paucibacter sp. PLA-PC-4 TaxID=2993655 RepID=UPI00224A726C|nr:NAD-dependent epimerase/dehydratase family protein [Paucibacter sp. PLA-PC-4]MCX2865140.1 NAD-dependent epimerase/dehydratase family protein [Paucibacter sp. PLA-PC-4]
MKILVTGGAGFIGSWLVESLLAAGHGVTVVDNLSPQIHGALPTPDVGWLQRPDSGVEFIRADVRDRDAMDQALAGVDAVVHLAAETGTGQSMYQISHYYDVNQQATASLFEAIVTRHRHVRRVILASSRSVYGEGAYRLHDQLLVPPSRALSRLEAGQFEPVGPNGEPLELVPTPESALALPASVYAATKLANETLGSVMASTYGLKVVALRFQNVYGERQSLRNPYTGILSIFSNRMRQGLPINIFEDGLESRDFVHVSDVARAIRLGLEADLPPFTVTNVGSGVPTPVLHVADLLRQQLGSTSELQVTGDYRAGDIRHCYADLTQARAVLGFAPEIGLEQGLQAFCDWVMTQPVLVDRSAQALKELTQAGLGKSSS